MAFLESAARGEEIRQRSEGEAREESRQAAAAAATASFSSRCRLRARFDSYSCHSPLTSASLQEEGGRVCQSMALGRKAAKAWTRDAHGGHLGRGLLGREVGHAERFVRSRAPCRVEGEERLCDVESSGRKVPVRARGVSAHLRAWGSGKEPREPVPVPENALGESLPQLRLDDLLGLDELVPRQVV